MKTVMMEAQDLPNVFAEWLPGQELLKLSASSEKLTEASADRTRIFQYGNCLQQRKRIMTVEHLPC